MFHLPVSVSRYLGKVYELKVVEILMTFYNEFERYDKLCNRLFEIYQEFKEYEDLKTPIKRLCKFVGIYNLIIDLERNLLNVLNLEPLNDDLYSLIYNFKNLCEQLNKRLEELRKEIKNKAINTLIEFFNILEERYGYISKKEKISILENIRKHIYIPEDLIEDLANVVKIGKTKQRVRRIRRDKIRNEVLKRDNYQCVICKSKENLEVHHLIPYFRFLLPKNADNLENLITLCRSCHYAIEHAKLRLPITDDLSLKLWLAIWLCKPDKYFKRPVLIAEGIYDSLKNILKSHENLGNIEIVKNFSPKSIGSVAIGYINDKGRWVISEEENRKLVEFVRLVKLKMNEIDPQTLERFKSIILNAIIEER